MEGLRRSSDLGILDRQRAAAVILCSEPLPQTGDAGRMPMPATRRFDLAPIEFGGDGGMENRPRGDHVGNSLPQVFGALLGPGASRRQGRQIASCSAPKRRCPIRVAEGSALLSEPLPGHGERVPPDAAVAEMQQERVVPR